MAQSQESLKRELINKQQTLVRNTVNTLTQNGSLIRRLLSLPHWTERRQGSLIYERNEGVNYSGDYFGWEPLGHNPNSIYYYLYSDESTSDVTDYMEMLETRSPNNVTALRFVLTYEDNIIGQWITDVGVPGVEVIGDGIAHMHIHALRISAQYRGIRLYYDIYSRSETGVETLLAISQLSPELQRETSDTIPSEYIPQEEFNLEIKLRDHLISQTDRIVVKLHAIIVDDLEGSSVVDPTIEIYVEGNTLSRFELPVSYFNGYCEIERAETLPTWTADDESKVIYAEDTHTMYYGNNTAWVAAITNPLTTTGDIIYSSNNTGTPTRLGIGSAGDYLGIAAGIPAWQDPEARFYTQVELDAGQLDNRYYTEAEVDATFLKLDCSNDPLTGALEVKPSIATGTGNQIIDIQNQVALDAEAHLTCLRILGDALDPTGADTRIRGIAVNLSGVDASNVPESLEGIRIVMPSGLIGPARANTDAIHITEGDIHHDFSVPNTAGALFTAYDAIADVSLQHANSHIHFFDVSTANGEPSGKIVGLGVHAYVAPIHQHIGTYASPSQTEYAGRKINSGVNWADGIDGIECFVKKNDEVYIGSTSQFSEIEVVMGTPGTKPVTPTFWYNTAADTWTQFYPEDATDGFQKSGLIHWPLEDISALWTNNGDPGGAETSAGYWIKIIRTANPDPGAPIPTTMKIGVVTLYEWDKNGDVDIHSLQTSGNILIGGSNNELRFYEGANYVGFEAPALGADQIWVLPAVDGNLNDLLITNGAGVLSWGPIPAHLHDGDVLEHDGVNSDGGNFDFKTTGSFNLKASGDNTNYLSFTTTTIPDICHIAAVSADLEITATGGDISFDDENLITTGKTTTKNLEITGSNITYLDITDDIDAAITAATAGDTLVLAAGTYTITDNIDITKSISIVGQGKGITTITCVTDSKSIFDIIVSHVCIRDLTIDVTAAGCYSIRADGSGGNNLTDIFIQNVEINMNSHTGIQRGIYFLCASGEIWDTTINITSTDNSCYGIYYYTTASSEAATTLRCYNVQTTLSIGGGSGRGFYCYDNGSSNDAFLYLYNCSTLVTESAAASSYGSNASGDNAYIYADNCVFNATDDDVKSSSSGTVELHDCVLINNSTSGTITYTGTNVTDQLQVATNVLIKDQGECRFYEGTNYVGFEAPALGADQIWVLPNADGGAGDVLQTNGGGVLSWGAGGGADEKVKIDAAATAGYIGAASNDGVLRTLTPLTYTDGGDFVTIDLDETAIDHNVLNNLAVGDVHTQYVLRQPTADTVINNAAGDFNWRMASTGDANLFFLDAGLDRIGIGTAAPVTLLTVEGVLSTREQNLGLPDIIANYGQWINDSNDNRFKGVDPNGKVHQLGIENGEVFQGQDLAEDAEGGLRWYSDMTAHGGETAAATVTAAPVYGFTFGANYGCTDAHGIWSWMARRDDVPTYEQSEVSIGVPIKAWANGGDATIRARIKVNDVSYLDKFYLWWNDVSNANAITTRGRTDVLGNMANDTWYEASWNITLPTVATNGGLRIGVWAVGNDIPAPGPTMELINVYVEWIGIRIWAG